MHLLRWFLVVAVLLTGACTPDARPRGSAPAVDPQFVGRWDWVRSTGGYAGGEVTPLRLGHRIALEFTHEGTYHEYWNGLPKIQTRFRVQEGHAFTTADSIVLLVLLDTSEFFRKFGEEVLAIRQAGADTLVLIGSSSEAWYHTLVREPAEESKSRR